MASPASEIDLRTPPYARCSFTNDHLFQADDPHVAASAWHSPSSRTFAMMSYGVNFFPRDTDRCPSVATTSGCSVRMGTRFRDADQSLLCGPHRRSRARRISPLLPATWSAHQCTVTGFSQRTWKQRLTPKNIECAARPRAVQCGDRPPPHSRGDGRGRSAVTARCDRAADPARASSPRTDPFLVPAKAT